MAKRPEEIRRFWALLDRPIDAHWREINTRRDGAAYTTIEALMFSLRRGPEALTHPDTLNRLALLSEQQLLWVTSRLQTLKPKIAPAWTREQFEVLFAVRRKV